MVEAVPRLAVAFLALMLLPTVLAGHSVTTNYALGHGQFVARVGAANVGGAVFPANGEVPTRVALADLSGTAAPFFACQDLDGDGGCGLGALDPAWIGCGASDLGGSEVPFRPDLETTVFVGAVALACPGGVGTRGTMTVTFG